LEKDRLLFARQCESYAFVFFSVVMVGVAFARLYYVWLIRELYIALTPEEDHRGARSGGGYGYAPVERNAGGTTKVVYSGSRNVNTREQQEEA
jgi:hypothetical protein